MHLVEGYLPLEQCIIWFVLSAVVVAYGIYQLRGLINEKPEYKKILTVSGLLMLVMSFFSFSSVKGSCSHPTGNGLGGVVFGPAITSVLAAIVLILECFLLGYGGLSTLGANIFSLGVFGPLIAALIYKGLKRVNLPTVLVVIVAVFFANAATYFITAIQLALAFPDPNVFTAFYIIFVIFFVTELPLAIFDCIVTAVIWIILEKYTSNSLS